MEPPWTMKSKRKIGIIIVSAVLLEVGIYLFWPRPTQDAELWGLMEPSEALFDNETDPLRAKIQLQLGNIETNLIDLTNRLSSFSLRVAAANAIARLPTQKLKN